MDYTAKVKKEVIDQLASGALTHGDIRLIGRWVDSIENNGLASVQTELWNDHSLAGEWAGHRSASFGPMIRLIYRVHEDRLIVLAVRITATHDYRK